MVRSSNTPKTRTNKTEAPIKERFQRAISKGKIGGRCGRFPRKRKRRIAQGEETNPRELLVVCQKKETRLLRFNQKGKKKQHRTKRGAREGFCKKERSEPRRGKGRHKKTSECPLPQEKKGTRGGGKIPDEHYRNSFRKGKGGKSGKRTRRVFFGGTADRLTHKKGSLFKKGSHPFQT